MTKRLLSVITLLVQAAAAFFIFNIFKFILFTLPYINVFFWITRIAVLFLILSCFGSILHIFKNVPFINSKAYLLLSIIPLVTFFFVCVCEIVCNLMNMWFNNKQVIILSAVCALLILNIILERIKRSEKIPYDRKIDVKETLKSLKNKGMSFMIAFLGILCAGIGAVIAELNVGWYVSIGAGFDGRSVFNPAALIFVAIGLIVGLLIGYFVKRLLSTIKESKKDTSRSSADEISKFKELLDSGTITEEEFKEKKRKLLNL